MWRAVALSKPVWEALSELAGKGLQPAPRKGRRPVYPDVFCQPLTVWRREAHRVVKPGDGAIAGLADTARRAGWCEADSFAAIAFPASVRRCLAASPSRHGRYRGDLSSDPRDRLRHAIDGTGQQNVARGLRMLPRRGRIGAAS